MSLVRYHLVVVGAGSAGLASAALAAELGASVALIERQRLGGDRLCYRVPAAIVIKAARERAARDRRADGGDLTPASADDVAVAAILRRARRSRTAAGASSDAGSMRELGVDVVHGEARFVAGDAVEVAGRRLEFQRAVVATGARTALPRIDGLAGVTFRTPETLFELETLPSRWGVIGAGSRGCEMAQAFAGLGCETHLFVAGERLLSGRDADAAAMVAETLRRNGVKIHLNSRALEIRRRESTSEVRVLLPGGRSELVDELLVATGPVPNVEGLGLEAAGVEYDLSGIEVDRQLRTSNRRIYAAGSVVTSERGAWDLSPPGLAADADARLAVRNALLFRHLGRRRSTVPRVTYTRPEIACVGLGHREAAAAAERVETLTVPMSDVDRGGLFGGEQGFLRLYLKRRGGEILGGTLVADRAAELIAPLTIAVNRKMRLGAFAEIPLPHPTRGEIYRRAAFLWRRHKAPRRPAPLMSFWLRLTSRL